MKLCYMYIAKAQAKAKAKVVKARVNTKAQPRLKANRKKYGSKDPGNNKSQTRGKGNGTTWRDPNRQLCDVKWQDVCGLIQLLPGSYSTSLLL